jgi:hypothetical protein
MNNLIKSGCDYDMDKPQSKNGLKSSKQILDVNSEVFSIPYMLNVSNENSLNTLKDATRLLDYFDGILQHLSKIVFVKDIQENLKDVTTEFVNNLEEFDKTFTNQTSEFVVTDFFNKSKDYRKEASNLLNFQTTMMQELNARLRNVLQSE